MTQWLFDTLVWTGALIALALLLRRPVAHWFGPRIAYALWALPTLRLFLPPIELPAWMAPEAAPVPAAETAVAGAEQVVLLVPVDPVPVAEGNWFAELPLVELALVLWLTGTLAFLYRRFRGYAEMREEMLTNARTVGRVGKIRLIETPATSAPLAFGVTDKVVALPQGFMAQSDMAIRNLALEHELSHHRGHDLLTNFLVQPLFAMHWFNPLGYLGWLALRRDQEAACDARVVSSREPEIRATYANVIASFAAGPNVALAAPMACPVLGDKSIIHRLRSLRMNEFSNRRRLAGRGLVAAALIALPLTASISYAENTPPEVPAPPAPPAPPEAPVAPVAPAAPVALQAANEVGEVEESDGETQVFVIKTDGEDGKTEEVRKVRVVKKIEGEKGAKPLKVHREERIIIKGDGEKLSKEELAELRRELAEGMAEMDIELKEAMEEQRHALIELHELEGDMVDIKIDCNDGKAKEWTDKNGRKITKICATSVMASALGGLKQARASIAADKEMPAEVRAEVLRSLDEKIREMQARRN
ncbi:Regulatory sensor-transducer, BlaR1 /MecR1 family [Altererythrobacter epoxidivorans]|uniref:Regulatory sensor-transducer, BlaR1 /MecR1 family n=1 Tax=Altererythrobacter epoxidivorans TaxID=361183 RepID=A0A0M3TA91_9SPHN|nr:M56 family metallopeptidase [Altererythrobacter epoxidivorans]ALE16642.1 Regulatory sensor-transducer, BlaR1 /MecR1 family [Altererythrobacter epoxidivorans]